LSWTFSDFPSGTQCSLSSSDESLTPATVSISASTPSTEQTGSGPGSFNVRTVGSSDPLTTGNGSYVYTTSESGTYTATLTCNGITQTVEYQVSEIIP
jgi:hypothetical protein